MIVHLSVCLSVCLSRSVVVLCNPINLLLLPVAGHCIVCYHYLLSALCWVTDWSVTCEAWGIIGVGKGGVGAVVRVVSGVGGPKHTFRESYHLGKIGNMLKDKAWGQQKP